MSPAPNNTAGAWAFKFARSFAGYSSSARVTAHIPCEKRASSSSARRPDRSNSFAILAASSGGSESSRSRSSDGHPASAAGRLSFEFWIWRANWFQAASVNGAASRASA
jgi:hypothetical protein